ncbi:MAG: FG-GAP repeat domain-containing protein [Sulfurimicrobium sp.]
MVTRQGEARLAATSHTEGVLEVWGLGPQRKLELLARDDRVGFHPDGVRWINDSEIAVAAEGRGEMQRWRYENHKLDLLQAFRVKSPPIDLTPVDLGQDGHLDYVLGPYAGRQVMVLWGQDNGQPREALLQGDLTPSYPRLVDWDQDGKTDIVWSDRDVGSVRLARNLGKQSFDVKILRPAAPGAPRQVAVGDIDSDGYPDLVMSMEAGKCARILFNDRKGGIASEAEIPAPISGYSAAAITRIDGAPMLALSEEGMIVLARPGPAGVHGPWQLRILPAGSLPLDLQFIDLDRDGEPDLVFANTGGNTVQIIFGPLWEKATPLP